MNRPLRTTLLLAAPLLLAGCTFTLGPTPTPNPFEGAQVVSVTEDRANAGGPTPVAMEVPIAADEPSFFVVTVPDERAESLLYLEAYDGARNPLTVEVFESATGDVLYRSTDPATYTDASVATTSASTGLGAQQVVRRACEGPCVIVPNTANTVYLKVSTSSVATVDYNLFVYDATHDEASEPGNDDCTSTTATTAAGGSYFGAVETLGDFDCILHTGDATSVEINYVGQSDVIELAVSIVTGSRSYLRTVSAAEPTVTVVTTSPILRIEIEGSAEAAGPPTGSSYSVFF